MGKASRDKGARFEREMVNWFIGQNIMAERVPLSGAAKGSYAADIRFGPVLAWSGECKRFANGLGKLYDALSQDDADVIFARSDRRETLVCMTLDTFKALTDEDSWSGDTYPIEMRGAVE